MFLGNVEMTSVVCFTGAILLIAIVLIAVSIVYSIYTKKQEKAPLSKTLKDYYKELRVVATVFLDGHTEYHIEKYCPRTTIAHGMWEKCSFVTVPARSTLFEAIAIKNAEAERRYEADRRETAVKTFVIDNDTWEVTDTSLPKSKRAK